MSATAYTEQSAADIQFYLLTTPVDESQLTIYETSVYQWGAYEITVKILGESHLVAIAGADDFLEEICVCQPITINTDTCVETGALTTLPSPFSHETAQLSYQLIHEERPLAPGDPELDSLLAHIAEPTSLTTHTEFPPDDTTSDFTPITLVTLTIGEKLTIETVHTYPNEQVYVYTASTISHKTP